MKTSPHLLILGYGNVAQALLPLMASRHTWLTQELGIQPLISGLGSRRNGFFIHPTGLPAADLSSSSEALQLLRQTGQTCEDALAFIHAGQAAGADTLLELTTLNPENGEPALSHIRAALEAGMDVVTANKGPLAHASAALHQLASSKGAHLRYESTVMDGLPLLNLVEFTLPAVGIHGWRGLLNSTSGIVLRQMEEGQSLAEAIQLAQQIGVAEANPWYDLDGWDATMKTTILTNALLNAHITPSLVQRTGIRDLTQTEIIDAARTGTPIRLVSSAHLVNGSPVAMVRPERLPASDPLYAARDSGMVLLETEAMGRITLIEHDTDAVQTAYGVLSDLIAIQRAKAHHRA
jgi:homoserine dehydrogenase